MRLFAMIQDNRESGVNPGRSRRCIRGAFFISRKAVTVKMGRQKNVKKRSQKTCLFVSNRKNCDGQALMTIFSRGLFCALTHFLIE